MSSRYIPKPVDKAVKERHFFECAWCGEKLFERHHIVEYAKGGEHSEGNLILLCNNCHAQVHRGEIAEEELLKRKSTHSKGEHLSGGVNFNLEKLKVKIGGGFMENVPIPLCYRGTNIVEIVMKNEEFLISTRFYDIEGELIFWMSSNRYWTKSNFHISMRNRSLKIENIDDGNNFIEINQIGDYLEIYGTNYLGNDVLGLYPDYLQVGTNQFTIGNMSNGLIGMSLWI